MNTPAQENQQDIFRRIYPDLRRFANIVRRSEEDPDDLVHDALVKVLSRGTLTELESPAAYIRKAIFSIAVDNSRSLVRSTSALHKIGPEQPMAPQYPSDLQPLDQLSPKDRAIIYLKDVEGWEFSEIEQLTGITSDKARKRASRARQRLRVLYRGIE